MFTWFCLAHTQIPLLDYPQWTSMPAASCPTSYLNGNGTEKNRCETSHAGSGDVQLSVLVYKAISILRGIVVKRPPLSPKEPIFNHIQDMNRNVDLIPNHVTEPFFGFFNQFWGPVERRET